MALELHRTLKRANCAAVFVSAWVPKQISGSGLPPDMIFGKSSAPQGILTCSICNNCSESSIQPQRKPQSRVWRKHQKWHRREWRDGARVVAPRPRARSGALGTLPCSGPLCKYLVCCYAHDTSSSRWARTFQPGHSRSKVSIGQNANETAFGSIFSLS